MNENNPQSANRRSTSNPFYFVPEEFLDNIMARQDRILEFIDSMDKPGLNGYITEKQAEEILHKKSTWFWNMRKSGQLPFKKIGNTIYYAVTDINGLLDM